MSKKKKPAAGDKAYSDKSTSVDSKKPVDQESQKPDTSTTESKAEGEADAAAEKAAAEKAAAEKAAAEKAAAEKADQPGGPKLFKVSVDSKTPLPKNKIVVKAVDEKEAWKKFCFVNGIVDTDCPKTFTEMDPADVKGDKVQE